MENIARVGIDLAKKVIHVTAVDDAGAVIERKKLRRAGLQSYRALLPTGCTVAMESCSYARDGPPVNLPELLGQLDKSRWSMPVTTGFVRLP